MPVHTVNPELITREGSSTDILDCVVILNLNIGHTNQAIVESSASVCLVALEEIRSVEDHRLTKEFTAMKMPGDEVVKACLNVGCHVKAVVGAREPFDPG